MPSVPGSSYQSGDLKRHQFRSRGSYLSSHDPRMVLDWANETRSIGWRSQWPQPMGRRSGFTDLPVDRYITKARVRAVEVGVQWRFPFVSEDMESRRCSALAHSGCDCWRPLALVSPGDAQVERNRSKPHPRKSPTDRKDGEEAWDGAASRNGVADAEQRSHAGVRSRKRSRTSCLHVTSHNEYAASSTWRSAMWGRASSQGD